MEAGSQDKMFEKREGLDQARLDLSGEIPDDLRAALETVYRLIDSFDRALTREEKAPARSDSDPNP